MTWVRALFVALCALLLGPAPGAHADCADPNAPEGVMLYNTNENVPQYCDGTAWTRLAPPPLGLPSEGLVGHWKLDESGNVSTAVDSAGTNNGALTSFPADPSANWVAGQFGNALDFDGSNDNVNAGNTTTLDNLPQMTVSAWIRPDSAGDNTRGAIVNNAQGGANDPTAGWNFRITSGFSLEFAVDYNTTNFERESSNGLVSTGVWQHVAFTWTGGAAATTARIYINGVETTYKSPVNGSASRVDDSAATLRIGNTPDNTSTFEGRIDDVRIYNRALTAEEIARCCGGMPAADKGDFTTGLAGHWKLDETTGTTADDAAGMNDGAMQGGLDAANNAVTGVRGGALEFDGNNDFVDLGTSAALRFAENDDWTVSGWFMSRDIVTDDNAFISRSANSGSETHFAIRIDAGAAPQNIEVLTLDAGTVSINSGNVIYPDTWYFVALSNDGGAMTLYLYDSSGLVAQVAGSHDGNHAQMNSYSTQIGTRNEGDQDNFNGQLDDVRIYNRGLTAADVKALYMNSAKYCENPNGVPGQLHYNMNTHAPMYCDGGHWVALAPDVLGKGLVGHWKLDEASGTLADSSGYGNDGTQSGGVGYSAAGMIGAALNFDGNDDYADMDTFPGIDFSQSYTVSLWAKPERFGDPASDCGVKSAVVFSKNDGPPTWDGGLGIQLQGDSTDVFQFDHDDTAGNSYWLDSNTVTLGNWYHLIAIYDASKDSLEFHMDGVLQNSASIAPGETPYNPVDDPITIGGEDPNCGSDFFDGSVDDLRIYNRALSAAEVTALYKQGLLDDGLIAHWPLNEDGGAIATDMAGDNIGYASGGVVFGSAGKIGLAAEFDGDDDYLSHGLELPVNEGTISHWLKPVSGAATGIAYYQADYPNGTGTYDGLADTDVHEIHTNQRSSGSRWEAHYQDGPAAGGYFLLQGPDGGVDAGVWQHIVFTWKRAGFAKLYKNGLEISSADISGKTFSNYTPTVHYIGRPQKMSAGRKWNGDIDDIRVYNRQLSAAEIAEIYAAGAAGLAAQDCTNPNGAEGAIIYNLNENAPQYCDGARWVKLGGP